MKKHLSCFCLGILGAALLLASAAAQAETVKIGVLKSSSYGPLFIAKDKGYFAAEGLDGQFVDFDAAQPVSVAVVSGAIDFGTAGLTAAFYSLAGQGALRIIGGSFMDAPGYQTGTVLASKTAYAAGLKSFKDLGGHSIGVSQIGSALHYELGLVLDKEGIDIKTVRVMPMQSIPNEVAAVTGNQLDAAVVAGSYGVAALQRGDVKLLGFVGDVAKWQLGALFTSARMADEHHDTVEKFLAAFRKGAKDYCAAFIGPDGRPKDGPTAPAMRVILSKYTGETTKELKQDMTFVDCNARVDIQGVLRQIAWYKAHNLLKGNVDGNALIDKRYVVDLPETGAK